MPRFSHLLHFFQKPQRLLLLAALLLSACATPYPDLNLRSGPVTQRPYAVLHGGIAYAPAGAPLAVKRAIWAGNALRKQPYRYSGGHRRFICKGYDCSGAVSFVLHYAGLLNTADDSRSLRNYGEPGPGRWITVYARNGHAFMRVAGLRLDTTGRYGQNGPRWRKFERSLSGYSIRHPAGY